MGYNIHIYVLWRINMSFLGLETYELLKEQDLNDINSKGYILRHKKSGARLALISNDDDNKVFYIGFRTPPEDETGVPHIIEHTVLCGSDKFPVKDPFVELVKGSLNTFLNAMTYPDKTMYPIASYNEKDFKNLMDVYLDAVFHPNILTVEEIFKQEGWHYELEEKDGPITINGVVYNEMKGAYSSPDEMLQKCMNEALFPDNTYSKDSGGNPDCIPELTYEDFVGFYKKYYHPSNSYIYLYGDCDMKERLEWMDKEYLCHFDVSEVDSQIHEQKAYDKVKDITEKYPISSEESEENNTYLAYSKVVGNILDKTLCQAMAVLDYALVTAPGAPVRKALIDAGIGQDVYGGFDEGMLQPTFSIMAKNANASDKERFVEIIESTLKKVVEEGVKETSILASINNTEFRFREADFGNYPKGLLYGIQCMETWLFDDMQPFANMELLDTFQFLREQIGKGYYEELIQKYLLDNTHGVVVTMLPEKGLNNQKEETLEANLAAYKETLSEEELETLIQETNHLIEYQETPSPEEDLQKIPMLERKDLRKEVTPYHNTKKQIGDTPVMLHDIYTNGIDYLTFIFDVDDVASEDIPYMSFIRSLMTNVDTENYAYAELADAVNIHSGGMGANIYVYTDAKEIGKNRVTFEFNVKALENKLEDALDVLKELMLSSKLGDVKRVTEILAQTKSRLQTTLSSYGNTVSAIRSLAYASDYAYVKDAMSGIAYYEAICQMDEQMKKDPSLVTDRLYKVMKQIVGQNRLQVSITATEEGYEKAVPVLEKFINALPKGVEVGSPMRTTLGKKNEGFTDASAIQYVSRSGNFAKHGFDYTGTLNILKMILNYEYLWVNVRVKGGAYGCSSSFLRTGESFFSSYRDPNLKKTNEVYDGIPAYLREFTADEREMTKYIIGTIGGIDTPMNPDAKGIRSMTAYLRNISIEMIQKERDEILTATQEDIRALADLVEAVLSDENICVIGNENNIRKEEAMFMNIKNLNE